jgi:hypothetical protein
VVARLAVPPVAVAPRLAVAGALGRLLARRLHAELNRHSPDAKGVDTQIDAGVSIEPRHR